MLRSQTWKPNYYYFFFFLRKISNVRFHLQTVSTNMTYPNDYSCKKRQLRHSNFKCVENILRRNKNHKTHAKQALIFHQFLFGDFNNSDIFSQIQNFNNLQFDPVITHWTNTCLSPCRPSKCSKFYTNRILGEQSLRQEVRKCYQNFNLNRMKHLVKYTLTVQF